MRVDGRYGMTSDEDEDTTRYNFAKCSLLLREVADRASQVFCEGRPINESELRQIHAELNKAWHIVISESFYAGRAKNPSPGAWHAEDQTLYSDGTPVATIAIYRGNPIQHVPQHFREREITPLADNIGQMGCWDKLLSADHVNLNMPPHDRPVTKSGRKPSRRNPAKRGSVVGTSKAGQEAATPPKTGSLQERLARRYSPSHPVAGGSS